MSASHTRAHEPVHHEPDYTLAVRDLTARFEGVFSPEDVEAAIEEARGEIEPGSRIHDFLELLVERRALEILRARARAAGRRPEPV